MRSWLSLAMLLLALPATAQDHADKPTTPDDVVVTGNLQREKQIRAFVRGMTQTPGTEPLARFDNGKLCPLTIGLTPDENLAISARMRRVAAAAKIAVARADCPHANALLLFANNKDAMIQLLREKFPGLLRDPQGNALAVPKEEGPAAVWHLGGVVDRDGMPLVARSDGPYIARSTIAASRIQATARPVYLMSVVVIERRALPGLTPTQIADYATMRALTDASPARARATGAPTILTVLESAMGSETPPTLTAWDMSFIRGLYAVSPNLHPSAQRGAIGETMKRELGKDAASEH